MSDVAASLPPTASWAMRLRQVGAIVRVETLRRFRGRRAVPLYFLALLPTVPPAIRLLVGLVSGIDRDPIEDQQAYAAIYQLTILRVSVFFGSVAIFTNLVRGEILDKSLHYWFLTPVHRGVLTVGKYLSGVAAGSILFSLSAILTWALVLLAHGPGAMLAAAFGRDGIVEIGTYVALVVLAVIGYGAVFLAASVAFRSPFIPAMAIWIWEWANFLLPPLLKKVSVAYYVQSLVPLKLGEGPFAILADPAHPALAVPGLLAVSAAFLALAGFGLRKTEIRYGGD